MITKLVTHYEYFARNEARYEARNAPVYDASRKLGARACSSRVQAQYRVELGVHLK